MIALGIDPGTAIVGYGFIEENRDGSLTPIAYGVIRTPAKTPMPERLHTIYTELRQLIELHKPDRAAVEELFFAKNVTTALTVAQSRGVILLALQLAQLTINEYKPNFIKQSITGYGSAQKSQMQEMVRMLLNLETIPKPDDAADALAVAITDIHNSRFSGLL